MRLPFQSIKICGFRSISDDGLVLENISSLNFLCGQNNSGKSNILTFVQLLFNHISPGQRYQFKPTDYHQGGSRQISFSILPDREFLSRDESIDSNIRDFYRDWAKDPLPWFNYSVDGNATPDFNLGALAADTSHHNYLNAQQWQAYLQRIVNATGGDIRTRIIEIFKRAHPLTFLKTHADLIPALRTLSEIKQEGITIKNNRPHYGGRRYFGGMGTIDLLFHNQHPPVGQESLLDDFRKVQTFLRYITGNSSAEIEIPADKSALIVNIDGKRLPISSLGTGIEELVIISTAAVNFHNQVVCIEEPELHIHPLLQRKFIEFLQKETDNIYFIATHSPHILDASSASVYHIQLKDKSSTAAHCNTGSDRFQICRDLGYQASDLLQANSIVWVEGPSDRIYLSAWLSYVASDLIEGLDFSIMFYGGRLLSHLSADDQLVIDFINLNRLNRNVAVVIDSDKDSDIASVNDTKQRIGTELEQNGGFEWVTQGREIENYLDDSIYLQAMQKISSVPNSGYESAYSDRCVYSHDGKSRAVNKLKLARAAMELPPNVDVLDLRAKLEELVAFIRGASGKNI